MGPQRGSRFSENRCSSDAQMRALPLLGRGASRRGPSACKVGNTRERCFERIGNPGSSHEVFVAYVVANRQQGYAARREPRGQRGSKAYATVAQHALQLGVLAAGGLAIGGEEERRWALRQPVDE